MVVLLVGCSTTQSVRLTESHEEIKNVSIVHLSQPASAAQYEKQEVRFTAKFGRVSSGFGIIGMEQYQFTHFLVSWVGEAGKTTLPYVLIPTYEQLLPTLRSGDLVQVEGVPHIVSDIYVFIVVMNLNKL